VPQDQTAIVQKMIDAGESEENIATVIQHYKAADAPESAMKARQSGFGASDRTDESPSAIGQWFETHLRPLLEQVAHPKTISDIAALLVPDQGVTASVRAGVKAGTAVGRGTAAALTSPGARTAAAEIVKHGSTATGAYVGGAPGAIVGSTVGESIAARLRPSAAAAKVADEAVSLPGYPRGGSTAAPVPAAPVPAVPAAVVDEFTAARSAKASAARQPGAGTLPDQKALNDAALAERRAAYQASQQQAPAAAVESLPPAGPVVKESGKMQLTAPEMKEFSRLLKRGLSLEDSLTAVKSARSLAAKLGGATDAQVAAAVAHRGATGAW
jgi:hypothetical protein